MNPTNPFVTTRPIRFFEKYLSRDDSIVVFVRNSEGKVHKKGEPQLSHFGWDTIAFVSMLQEQITLIFENDFVVSSEGFAVSPHIVLHAKANSSDDELLQIVFRFDKLIDQLRAVLVELLRRECRRASAVTLVGHEVDIAETIQKCLQQTAAAWLPFTIGRVHVRLDSDQVMSNKAELAAAKLKWAVSTELLIGEQQIASAQHALEALRSQQEAALHMLKTDSAIASERARGEFALEMENKLLTARHKLSALQAKLYVETNGASLLYADPATAVRLEEIRSLAKTQVEMNGKLWNLLQSWLERNDSHGGNINIQGVQPPGKG